ncbi:MAG TPA: N-acetyltransferase [Desulfomonilaceae bacterium]|nr:N-acetyltransferase [Desulfomonilaceae bacterium]
MIRKAMLQDVTAMHRLIAEQAKAGHLIPRAISELYSQVRDFTVRMDDGSEVIIACGALHIVWEDLAEIRSLAVQTDYQGRGIGSELIRALLEESRMMKIRRVFVLTDRTSLFERLGFSQIDKSLLPHKIWADCIRCNKFPECDEVAMATNP